MVCGLILDFSLSGGVLRRAECFCDFLLWLCELLNVFRLGKLLYVWGLQMVWFVWVV